MRKSMTITKNDMARVIVQALQNRDELPPTDHFMVKRIERNKKTELESRHKEAIKILLKKI